MKQGLPRAAVLLAACNGRQWIETQIDTILAQQHVEVVLFVSVDPGSDATDTYVEGRARSDKRIILLPESGPFGCAARNFYRLMREVDMHEFEFIALADQDDCWNQDKLAHACRALEAGDAVAYSCSVTAVWPDGRKRKLDKSQTQRELDFLFEAAGPGCTYVFKRDFAQELQELLHTRAAEVESVLAHDWLFYAFCRSQGYRWIIDSESFVSYRQHGNNELGANYGFAGLRRRIHLMRSGWYRSQARQIASVCGMLKFSLVRQLLDNSWRGRLVLACNARKLRRRWRDSWLLALFSLLHLF